MRELLGLHLAVTRPLHRRIRPKSPSLFGAWPCAPYLALFTCLVQAGCNGKGGGDIGLADSGSRPAVFHQPDAGRGIAEIDARLGSDAGVSAGHFDADGGLLRDAKPAAKSTEAQPLGDREKLIAQTEAPPVSSICGDRIRDPATEACDDGGSGVACTATCQILTQRLLPPNGEFRLGGGRHAAAANARGFVVAGYVPALGEDGRTEVHVQLFDAVGRAQHLVDIGSGSTPVAFADPVAAMLPAGGAVGAWTALNADRDELAVALRTVEPDGTVGQLRAANSAEGFSQFAPDIIWTGDELVVAWADDRDPLTAPDLRFRKFGPELEPHGEQGTLSSSLDAEGRVSLASFSDVWVAAWRQATPDAREVIQVAVPEEDWSWTLGPHLAAEAGDTPAVLGLGERHVLVAFSVGVAPTASNADFRQQLFYAVLLTDELGSISAQPVPTMQEASSQHQPTLVKLAGQPFLAWQTLNPDGTVAMWTKRLVFDAATGELDVSLNEERLPVPAPQRTLTRFTPTFAVGTSPLLGGDGALLSAWNVRDTSGVQPTRPEVLARVQPWPPAPNPVTACGSKPCVAGTGPCEDDADCAEGLACLADAGLAFRLAADTAICAPEHCGNGVMDANENGTDCGGACGECWECPSEAENGGDDFCSALCPCALGQGDCDTDLQCEAGLICTQDEEAAPELAEREFCLEP